MGYSASTEDLLRQYREILVVMHEARVEGGGNPKGWNRLVDQMQRVHLELRETPEGRAGITSLTQDDCPTVRMWSAVNALAWDEAIARAELERHVSEESDLSGFEAGIVLREFDAGRLNTAWVPK